MNTAPQRLDLRHRRHRGAVRLHQVIDLALTVVLGFGYPLLVTGLSSALFSRQANGSLIYRNDKLIGSALLGQNFLRKNGAPISRYFQPRPSAAGAGYDGSSSGAGAAGVVSHRIGDVARRSWCLPCSDH